MAALDDILAGYEALRPAQEFLPPMQPCLRTGTEALLAAALAWLAP